MATNFPTNLDSLTNPTSTDSLANPDHATQHTNANDAIEALQAKVGVNGSAVTTTLDYKVSQTAPKSAQYVTLATDSTLTSERVLTAGSGVSLSDGGGGGNVTVASFTAGGAARPLLTAGAYLDGTNGIIINSLSGNYASTPDSAALSITGDIEIVARIARPNWAGTQVFVAKSNDPNQTSYRFQGSTGSLVLIWSTDGTNLTTATSTVAPTFVNGTQYWLKVTLDVDNGAGGYTVKFYQAPDSATEPVSWTQVGADVVGGSTTSIFNGTAPFEVGSRNLGGSGSFTGTISRTIIRSGIGGTVEFDANFATQTADALAFTESSTNAATVTINTTRYLCGVPGVINTNTSTGTFGSDTTQFNIFNITQAISVDMFLFEVTTGPTSNSTYKCAIYSADNNYNPVGLPVIDFGSVIVPALATGVFSKQITPITIQPGAYLVASNMSVSMSLRFFRGGQVWSPHTLGSSPYRAEPFLTQSNSAFPTSSPLPTALRSNAPPVNLVQLRWKAA